MPKNNRTAKLVYFNCPTCGKPCQRAASVVRANASRTLYCSRGCFRGPGRQWAPRAERFWEKVLKTDTCWLWVGGKGPNGYGTFCNQTTHRFSYELHYGPIPDGMLICHTCDVRMCVRPDHLFCGTPKDNIQDCIRKGRRNWDHVSGDNHHFRKRPNIVPKGGQCSLAKLAESQVVEIITKLRDGATGKDLSRTYGVNRATIWHIQNNRTWKHVPRD